MPPRTPHAWLMNFASSQSCGRWHCFVLPAKKIPYKYVTILTIQFPVFTITGIQGVSKCAILNTRYLTLQHENAFVYTTLRLHQKKFFCLVERKYRYVHMCIYVCTTVRVHV